MKKLINFITASILSFVATVGFCAAPVFADDDNSDDQKPAISIMISPVSNNPTLVAGEKTDYTFTVTNNGSATFSFRVYASPYTVANDSYNAQFDQETSYTQISRWIKFYNEDDELKSEVNFTIDPDEKIKVKYQIAVPDDVPAGGQYATIFAESDKVEGEVKSSGVKTSSRAGLIIFGHTDGETKKTAEISDYNIKTFLTSGAIGVSSKVSNTGNVDFSAVHNFTVKSLFGKALYETGDKSYSVLPETTRSTTLEWENTPLMGIFKVQYSVTAADQNISEEKVVVVLPTFAIILLVILLTLVIIWIIILIRKRRERRSRLLV